MERAERQQHKQQEDAFLEATMNTVQDEITSIAKTDDRVVNRVTTNEARPKFKSSILRKTKQVSFALGATIRRAARHVLNKTSPRVGFKWTNDLIEYNINDVPSAIYDSGADGTYVAEADREEAGLPILRNSTKRVRVANNASSEGKYETLLPFDNIPQSAREATLFEDFPHSLISVGKMAASGLISIFTKNDVEVHREEDVLIKCKGVPILVGKRDDQGRYRIPLILHKGQWQPRTPSSQEKITFEQANSVYNLPSTEEVIRWLHACCGFPVKSTWLKAIKKGNFVGWPLLNKRNVQKYYPETSETPKGHLKQTRKGVRSTKAKAIPFETADTAKMQGKRSRTSM